MRECAMPAPIALVSMPWSSAKLPSIQLATLDAALRGEGLTSNRHELFVDFCAQITPALYNRLANGDEFLIEWLFSRDYFGNETGNWLTDFEAARPKLDLPNDKYEQDIIEGLKAASTYFLDQCEADIDWRGYDIIGFSLSTQQLGPSIALARRIKKVHPEAHIIFGGSMCTGEAGSGILELCPYVDIVVRTEGEIVLPQIIRCLRANEPISKLPGISYRAENGSIISKESGPLFQNNTPRPFLNYDAYFEKIDRLGLKKSLNPIMSFESSRGCWWGEKSQCSFCGLHDIMKYRPKAQDFVLKEMEHLAERHNHSRFYAVDLIAPKPFYHTFFPEIERRGHRWQLFYEIKSNISRKQLVAFADGGGQVIQPGIESLQDGSLKRMHKGAHVLQNIQLLKWCRETGVMVYWNYLMSLPGEEATDYEGAAEKARKLFHLEPPSTIRDVLITRYAPYHKTPEKYDVINLRPHQNYAKVFPVDASVLENVAYLFEAKWPTKESAQEYTRALKNACLDWKTAFEKGAKLDAFKQADGSLKIIDTRFDHPLTHKLSPDDAALYLLLDSKQLIPRLGKKLAHTAPDCARRIASTGGVAERLKAWEESALTLKEGGQILALAVKKWQDHDAIAPKSEIDPNVVGEAAAIP